MCAPSLPSNTSLCVESGEKTRSNSKRARDVGSLPRHQGHVSPRPMWVEVMGEALGCGGGGMSSSSSSSSLVTKSGSGGGLVV